MRLVAVLGAAWLLTGCATPTDPNKLYLTIDSDPPGAMLAEMRPEGLRQLGMGPYRGAYLITEDVKKAGTLTTKPIQAMWKSGVVKTTVLTHDLSKGNQGRFTFVRPEGGDIAMDRRFAFDLQAKRQAKEDDDTGGGWGAAVLQGLAAGVADYGNSRTPTYPAVTPSPRVTCVSKRNGLNPSEVKTVCE